ncbi:MAG TPA: metallophosphoesterase family protein [Trebonia sp.]
MRAVAHNTDKSGIPHGSSRLVSRRSFLTGVTASGLLLAGPAFWQQPAKAGSAPAEQIHLQFGADPASDMTVSWVTPTSVSRPRVVIGTATDGFGRTAGAETRTYTDSINGVETITQHAPVRGLRPDTSYVYQVLSDGASPVNGTFRTAPKGRAAFRFTSFGDLATGNPAWSKSSLNAIPAIAQVEQFDPVVHLLNGDLSYANSNPTNQPGTWADFGNNTQVSAAFRPWMPTLGNHEIEAGNGTLGYNSYHTRYTLPSNQSNGFNGNWYSYQVGSVLFIALDNNDVVYENAGGAYYGNPSEGLYIRGYSSGEQEKWLERTLREASVNPTVDWIIAYMHQPALSTSSTGAGDLGIRQSWFPLFYKYGVDLVLAGHEHDYERSYAVHGTDAGTYLRPTVVSTDLTEVDTEKGLVHLVLGTGGTKGHDDVFTGSNTEYGDPVPAYVFTQPAAFGANPDGSETAYYSAVRDPDTTRPWGIGVFDVDPGRFAGDKTSITMTYYHTPTATSSNLYPAPVVYDTVMFTRTRRDGRLGNRGAA